MREVMILFHTTFIRTVKQVKITIILNIKLIFWKAGQNWKYNNGIQDLIQTVI